MSGSLRHSAKLRKKCLKPRRESVIMDHDDLMGFHQTNQHASPLEKFLSPVRQILEKRPRSF